MPKRTGRTVTVTGGPQGEDAFVIIKRMTVDESTDFAKLFANAQDKNAVDQEMAVRTAVSDLVIDWNWVDDNDEPLPKPHGNVAIVGTLLTHELKWLFEAVRGATDDQKKDLTPTPKS